MQFNQIIDNERETVESEHETSFEDKKQDEFQRHHYEEEEEEEMTVEEMFALRRKMEREKFSSVQRKYKGFESLLNNEDAEYDDSPPTPNG